MPILSNTPRNSLSRAKRPRREPVFIRQLDDGLWVIRESSAHFRCCFDSREAAIRALELTHGEGRQLQTRANKRSRGAGLVTYGDVVASLTARRARA